MNSLQHKEKSEAELFTFKKTILGNARLKENWYLYLAVRKPLNWKLNDEEEKKQAKCCLADWLSDELIHEE